MHSTRPVLMGRGSVSTHHGQRRILKHSTPDLLTYIQKAVQTGIYRSREEIEAMNTQLGEKPTELKRLRWHVPRGSKIQDYPSEYKILSLHPPEPFRPSMPLKDQRKAYNLYVHQHRPTDRLATQFLARHRQHDSSNITADEYYRRLLGVQRSTSASMGSKSALLNKAYAVAVKQYHLMRTENLSEQEALKQVDALLQEQDVHEQQTSRRRASDLAATAAPPASATVETRASTYFTNATSPSQTSKKKDDNDHDNGKDDSALALLYGRDQRALEGMISWAQRLEAVPYRQWTVGASVALDHWIAKRVLGLSEETWLALVEGDSPELLGRGRDVVMARRALFPETILGEDEYKTNELGKADDNDKDDDKSLEDDLDSLLATLGGWKAEEDSKRFDWKTDSQQDDRILVFTKELQDWRSKQQEQPYEEWSDEETEDFQIWLQEYVSTLTPESSIGKVDMEATREALLTVPPQTKEDSDRFWEAIKDETAAGVFLQDLLSDKNDVDRRHPFYQLEYSVQLERLVNLGAIRAIADEYATEDERSRFLARYGDYLLEGLEMDHLVPDHSGSIRGSDLGDRLMTEYNITPNERFRLEKIPFGTDAFGTEAAARARDIYRAWNGLKAGRAHYEEKLFHRGMLGLTYEKKKTKR